MSKSMAAMKQREARNKTLGESEQKAADSQIVDSTSKRKSDLRQTAVAIWSKDDKSLPSASSYLFTSTEREHMDTPLFGVSISKARCHPPANSAIHSHPQFVPPQHVPPARSLSANFSPDPSAPAQRAHRPPAQPQARTRPGPPLHSLPRTQPRSDAALIALPRLIGGSGRATP